MSRAPSKGTPLRKNLLRGALGASSIGKMRSHIPSIATLSETSSTLYMEPDKKTFKEDCSLQRAHFQVPSECIPLVMILAVL